MSIAPSDVETLSLAELRRLAGQFDAISDETGARYAAAAFVEFAILETRDEDDAARHDPRSDPVAQRPGETPGDARPPEPATAERGAPG